MFNKVLIGIVAIVMGGCLLTILAIPSIWQRITDPTRVNTVASTIADFDLPEGYQPDYVIEALGHTVAAYKSSDDLSHIVLMNPSNDMMHGQAGIEGFIPNDDSQNVWTDAQIQSRKQLQIRDYPAHMTTSDRTNGEGIRYRSINLVFEGKQGPALLVINQPLSQWDETTINTFIDSIR